MWYDAIKLKFEKIRKDFQITKGIVKNKNESQ